MDNTEIELLKQKVEKLEIENTPLKNKIKGMYECWFYDYSRFTELKNIYKNGS